MRPPARAPSRAVVRGEVGGWVARSGLAKRLPVDALGWHGWVVTPHREIRNLALVGFMGAGKSTVGRLVARQLGLRYVDTDEAIEARAGRPISCIFSESGESEFRRLERDCIAELGASRDLVISTGGGLACQPGNMERLKEHALVICLWASADTIWERVRHQHHRPLLQVADPKAEIVRLLAVREPYYRMADVLVNSGLRSLREVAAQVAHHFSAVRSGGFRGVSAESGGGAAEEPPADSKS